MTEILGNIEDLGNLRSDINQIGEEAVKRAQEENQKAQKVAQEIKKDKLINQHFALFLAMLLKKIQNEELISSIYNTFFKTINPENNITYLRKDTNAKVIAGFFIPFFLKEAEEYKILTFYKRLDAEKANSSVKSYIHYLEQLSATYHDNIPINQSAFVNLVILIIQHFIDNTPREELKNQIFNQLYERR